MIKTWEKAETSTPLRFAVWKSWEITADGSMWPTTVSLATQESQHLRERLWIAEIVDTLDDLLVISIVVNKERQDGEIKLPA